MNEKKLFENFILVSKRFDKDTRLLQANCNYFLASIGGKKLLIDWKNDTIMDFGSKQDAYDEIKLTESGYVLLRRFGSDAYTLLHPMIKNPFEHQVLDFKEYPNGYVCIKTNEQNGNRFCVLNKKSRMTISARHIDIFADKTALIQRTPYSKYSLVTLDGKVLISGIEKFRIDDEEIYIPYTDGISVAGFSAISSKERPQSLSVDRYGCIVIYYHCPEEYVVTNGEAVVRFKSRTTPIGNNLCVAERETPKGNKEKLLYRLSDGKLIGQVWDAKMNNQSGDYAYLKGTWTVCSESGRVLPIPQAVEVELFDNGDVGYRKSYSSGKHLYRRSGTDTKVNIGEGVATYCRPEDVEYDIAFCGSEFLVKNGENGINRLICQANSLSFSAEDVFPAAKDKIVLKLGKRYGLYDKNLRCLGVSEDKIEALSDGAVKLFDKDGKITFVTAKGTIIADKADDVLSSGRNIALVADNKLYILYEK